MRQKMPVSSSPVGSSYKHPFASSSSSSSSSSSLKESPSSSPLIGNRVTTKCSFYNETMCPGEGCKEEEECKMTDISSDKSNLCYVLWQNNSDGYTVKLKGCWLGSEKDCFERERCVERRKDPKLQLSFCCCSGDLCNKDMYHEPTLTSTPSTLAGPMSSPTPPNPEYYYSLSVILCTLIPFMLLTLVFIVAYWFYRCRKLRQFDEVPTREEFFAIPEHHRRPVLYKDIHKVEVKASGRFGTVWKARLEHVSNKEEDLFVAAKIFHGDRNSWNLELDVYKLTRMRHPNILHFLFAEERPAPTANNPLQTECWLVTEYHELGSLCDFLKSNLVTYQQLLIICEGIASGLSFLHEETHCKPAIAHRDFKSKNVILKNDLTPCIADFGLALIFKPGNTAYDTLGQVGTKRYMAPEVLEGAINFSRDGLLRIDMYACALVMWEVLSRCTAQDAPIGNYMLPFEEELGQDPNLEEIQDHVCQKKLRPVLKSYWWKIECLQAICKTIEDCWDQDAEARISASTVEHRMASFWQEYL